VRFFVITALAAAAFILAVFVALLGFNRIAGESSFIILFKLKETES